MQVRAAERPRKTELAVTPGRLLRALAAHDAFQSAAAVAFWLFLSLVPLLVLVGFVVGQVARRRGVHALTEPLLQVIPGTAEDLVRAEIERLTGSRASLAPLGVLGYLWAASSGVHNLLDAFERAVQAPRRAWWQKRIASLGWVTVGLAVACATAWCLVRVDSGWHGRAGHRETGSRGEVAGRAESVARPELAGKGERVARPEAAGKVESAGRAEPAAGGSPRPARPRAETLDERGEPAAIKPAPRRAQSLLEQSIDAAIVLAVGTGFLALFYRLTVPGRGSRARRVWPGTITSVGSWLTVSWAFGLYTASIAQYALFYGSLAAVAVLLIWLYLTSLSFMLGVEVNTMLDTRRTR